MNALAFWMFAYLLNSLWQVPLVFVAAWIAARLARPAGPRIEHRIWVTALLLEVALPACSLRLDDLWHGIVKLASWSTVSGGARGHVQVALGSSTANGASVLHLPSVLIVTMTVAYACSLLYFASRLAWGAYRTRSMLIQSVPIVLTGGLENQWRGCACSFGMDPQTATIAASPLVSGPVTVGILQRILLLPPRFLENVNGPDLDTVFAHECAHMCRRDFARNLLYRALSLPVAFHPLLWLTGSRLAETREMLCDQMAADALTGPDRYARSLLRLASLLSDRPPVPTLHAIGFFDANIFERRVMNLTRKRLQTSAARRLIIATVCGVVALITCASALALRMEVSTPATTPTNNTTKHPLQVKVDALKILTRVPPIYPIEAKANKDTLDGPVILAVRIGKDGRPEAIRVSKSLRDDYDRSALDAVKQWRFEPFLLNGNPVEVDTTLTITYNLAK